MREKFCYVGVPEVFSLGHCCHFISQAFGEHTCYIVGSANERPDFRDVDVVLIIGDAKYEALFGSLDNGELIPFWSLMMTAFSEYIAKRTGLRIDFKVQSMTQANGPAHKGKTRQPIGLFLNHDLPKWTELDFLAPTKESVASQASTVSHSEQNEGNV